jgi:hypothetical protein
MYWFDVCMEGIGLEWSEVPDRLNMTEVYICLFNTVSTRIPHRYQAS